MMGFYSEELRIMDRNTVLLMIEELQDELERLREQRSDPLERLKQKDLIIKEQEKRIAELEGLLAAAQ